MISVGLAITSWASISDAPRDKRTYFREINYIAAAFQYQKKNYKSA
ncbi:glucosamine-6-phosphate deaminase [Salmonella enterica subsp. enterica serovar Montevideo]|nr:glucosamine-6-phosphate deaminase [Salmonella enterica]EBC9673399.1 glucosamine-6-phosphate deaminase [Salmonella enterica subsp. enterica serovar Montevideo]EAU9966385.1 glucosamine-6-phosphate deaminase [Salmonella enterica]EBE3830181.1 glucosamine-6-phosphate deaminase [Salmonella enterica subsp. enterica serovar Montevideo]EBE3831472.1 glucosamine-6-phosphate deaminase [Salmonella enterica subsp. enterica serovar Montevideo]